MTDKTIEPGLSGMLPAAMLLAAVAAAALLWARSGGASEQEQRLAAYAGQCPRWVQLAEDLLPIEGGVPSKCEYVAGQTSMFSDAGHVYKAAPNIEVHVTLPRDVATKVPASVVIRDTKSRASVTYNAEALALLE